MEETQTGYKIRNHRGSPVNAGIKSGGSAGFVVILQKTRELA